MTGGEVLDVDCRDAYERTLINTEERGRVLLRRGPFVACRPSR